MDRKLLVVAALVLAVGIAVLFVLPAFDVLPTAMRAWRAAKILALAMTTLVSFFLAVPLVRICSLANAPSPIYSCLDLLDLTCSRLC